MLINSAFQFTISAIIELFFNKSVTFAVQKIN